MDQLASRVGARVWIDLRGAVTPKVTADRGVANVPEDAETWGAAVSKLWGRFRNHLCSELANSPTRIRNLLTLTIVSEQYSSILGKCNLPRAEVWGITGGIGELRFLAAQYHMILARDLMSELATAIQQAQSHSQQQESELITNPSRDVIDEYSAAKRRVQYLESLRDFALKLTPDMELSISLVLACLSASEFNISLVEFPKEDIKSTTLHLQDFPGWNSAYATAILNAAFGSDLAQSWVLLELFSLKGVIGNSTLVSPANCHFEFESDRQTVGFVDRDGAYPNQLTSLGYDLCYPISSIPLGRLRRDCARWRTDRRIQAVGTMPLLFPSYSDVWPIYRVPLRDLFGVPQIYALMPPPNLWLKPFADWSDEDWANPQHLSILWNIETGDVHYCGGIQTPAMTVRRGKTYKAAIRRIENKAK